MNDPFVVFGAPDLREEDIAEVVATLRSGWIGTGPRVARFEREFAAYKGCEAWQAAAVNSCTAALHVSMVAADLPPGSEVITTPLTFCATANAILHAGLLPVIADVDPRTQNIDPAAVEAAITPRTRAVLPVHLAGRPCDMDRIGAIARKHGLVLIEDCAHAVETRWRGQPAGTFGEYACFSFYVTKNLVTGEGGMVLGRERDRMDRIRILALHGMSKDAWKRFSDSGYKHYQVVETGFKYNMTDMQAALGLGQLARVEENWERRRALWSRYLEAFADLPIGLPSPTEAHERHAYHLFQVNVEAERCGIDRDSFLNAATRRGIGVGVHYLSLAEHPVYQQRLGWRPEQCPEALRIGRSTVSLPFSTRLDQSQIERVIDSVRAIVLGDR